MWLRETLETETKVRNAKGVKREQAVSPKGNLPCWKWGDWGWGGSWPCTGGNWMGREQRINPYQFA